MIRLAVLGGVLAASADKVNSAPLFIVLAGMLSGGVGVALINWLRHRKGDTADYTKAVAELQQTALEIMDRSGKLVADVQLELERVREELRETRAALNAATQRIAALEGQLLDANGKREKLLSNLVAAVNEREALQLQLAQLTSDMHRLEQGLLGKQDNPPTRK